MEIGMVEPGSIILVERTWKFYDHYAIYAGDRQVIHYAPKEDGGKTFIHKAGIEEFLDGSNRFYVPYLPQNKADVEALIKFHKQRRNIYQEIADELLNVYDETVAKVYTAAETLKRAVGRLGESLYNVIGNNCEHFAFWCKFKLRISSQINRIMDFVNSALMRCLCQRYHRYVSI